MRLGYIIDAHFASLVLAQESHPLLGAINEVLLSHMELCKQLPDQLGLIPHFFSRKPLPGSHAEIGHHRLRMLTTITVSVGSVVGMAAPIN